MCVFRYQVGVLEMAVFFVVYAGLFSSWFSELFKSSAMM
jgi:hypothetical protein